jgi:hypothetical protein
MKNRFQNLPFKFQLAPLHSGGLLACAGDAPGAGVHVYDMVRRAAQLLNAVAP